MIPHIRPFEMFRLNQNPIIQAVESTLQCTGFFAAYPSRFSYSFAFFIRPSYLLSTNIPLTA